MASSADSLRSSRSGSELELQLILDSAPALIHTAMPDGYIDFFNRTWLDYVGLRLEEMEGWKWTVVIHPDDLDGILQKWRASLASGEPFLHETRVRRADGEYRWMLHHKVALSDEKGESVKWYGSSMDIEDRRRAEDSLQKAITERKRAEQELQQLVDFVPLQIAVERPDGRLMNMNRMAREYLGLTIEQNRLTEVIDRIVHPDDLEKVRAIRKDGFSGVAPFEYDARLLAKDGVYRWFLVRYNPLIEEGCAKRWYTAATEIESRKQEEERVRQENVRLEERTRIAQELHDTLLQSFNGATISLWAAMAGLPSDSPLKPKIDSILDLMEKGIAEGRTAIQGLRSSGSGTPDLVAALSGIQKELVVPPEVDFRVSVVGHQKPLQQPIGQELYRIGKEALANAFRHSRGSRVEFELEYSDSHLDLRVRDNGQGIDPEVLAKGLEGHWGLAGMRERAARIGGQLKICNSTPEGTEVSLSIPGDLAFRRL